MIKCNSFAQGKARAKSALGFTLIEMLVSIVILVVLMAIIFQIIQLTSSAYKQTTQSTGTMQTARVAFERMTRNISQATLNTYYSYYYAAGATTPSYYMRQSELHFVSGYGPIAGSASTPFITATGQNAKQVTHAIFFQAPLGVVSSADTSTYGNLNSLLNACGYFVIYTQDTSRPSLFTATGSTTSSGLAAPPNEYRYRLMEYLQPSESFNLYTSQGIPSDGSMPPWISLGLGTDLTQSQASVRALASNIVALIIMPEQFSKGTTTNGQSNTSPVYSSTTASYSYDSAYNAKVKSGTVQTLTGNQLPPLVKVVMVAIDEASGAHLAAKYPSALSTSPPDLGNLPDSSPALFQNPSNLLTDLGTLEKTLGGLKANYFVFQTDVIIRGAKWTVN